VSALRAIDGNERSRVPRNGPCGLSQPCARRDEAGSDIVMLETPTCRRARDGSKPAVPRPCQSPTSAFVGARLMYPDGPSSSLGTVRHLGARSGFDHVPLQEPKLGAGRALRATACCHWACIVRHAPRYIRRRWRARRATTRWPYEDVDWFMPYRAGGISRCPVLPLKASPPRVGHARGPTREREAASQRLFWEKWGTSSMARDVRTPEGKLRTRVT